jgi:hypothetical protein
VLSLNLRRAGGYQISAASDGVTGLAWKKLVKKSRR